VHVADAELLAVELQVDTLALLLLSRRRGAVLFGGLFVPAGDRNEVAVE